MPVDLHVHSTYSDGENTPEQLIEMAKTCGLASIALTDHDSVGGIKAFVEKGIETQIGTIPGIEFTSEFQKSEIHILGYFIDYESQELLGILNKIQKDRKDRIVKIVQKLNKIGIEISADDVFEIAKNDSPGRPHVAKALIRSGAVSTFKEAFDRFIGHKGPAYVGHYKLTPFEAVKLIRQVKGAPVFAHPAVSDRDSIIPELMACGLKGIEVFYPTHRPEQVERYKNIAKKFELIMTGGSDFHGENSGRNIKLGGVAIDDKVVDELRKASI